jgi:AcrR family transcriptional regulator
MPSLSAVLAPPPAHAPAPADELEQRILDAALEQFRLLGIRRSSIDDVARRARVGRATVFRRFGSKDALVHALVLREVRAVLHMADAVVAEQRSLEARLVEGFRVCLRAAREHPLLTGMLAAEPETILPLLTTDAGEVIALVAAYLVGHYPDADVPEDPEQTAEVMTRIGLSLLLTPETSLSLEDDEQIRAFARRFLVPLAIRPSGG